MSEKSGIEWTDATWNPVTGCTKVSPGCDHCYASTFAERFRGVPGHPYENGFDLTLRPERLAQPQTWKRPHVIFVNSMSDLFHRDVPDDYIDSVFRTMVATQQDAEDFLGPRSDRELSMNRTLPGLVAARFEARGELLQDFASGFATPARQTERAVAVAI